MAAASARHNSVLPTPEGPSSRKLPVGEAIAGQDYEAAARLRDVEEDFVSQLQSARKRWSDDRTDELVSVTEEGLAADRQLVMGLVFVPEAQQDLHRRLRRGLLHRHRLLAREGKLDPVVGRDREIARCIRILSRRTKNIGPGRQSLGRRQPGQSRSHDINDRRPGPLGRNGLFCQAPVGRPRLLPQETQQQVFAAHIAVSQLLRRRLSQPKSVLRPGGESVPPQWPQWGSWQRRRRSPHRRRRQ